MNKIELLLSLIEDCKLYGYPWALCILIIWLVNLLNWSLKLQLNNLGNLPRTVSGLPGIILSPFLHKDFNHLFFNSIPLFILGLFILSQSLTIFFGLTIYIIIISGILVWLLGRNSTHIGASGLVSGYFGYIIYEAYFNPGLTTIITALIALYFFGGILFGLFPKEDQTSWESHLFGFASGVSSFYLNDLLKALNYQNLKPIIRVLDFYLP